MAPFLRRDLSRLGRFYGTNKAATYQSYTPHYERHLKHRRREPLCILEIGVGGFDQGPGGSSLRMWRSYFPRARVYGVDIEPRDLREPRITTFCGDQADSAFLRDVIDRIGTPDLVIDDGSHRSDDVIATFEVLFPALASGGLYVIEDLWFSYDPSFGGGPPGTDGTMVEMIKRFVDDVAVQRVDKGDIVGVHVYSRIAFIEKR